MTRPLVAPRSTAAVGGADLEEGGEVVRFHRAGQIPKTAFLVQELRGPRGERAEEQRLLAVEDAGVEVRHGHGRRGVEGLAVNLGLVLGDDGGVVADEPLAADGKAADALALGDAGFLEKLEAAAAGADEDKFGGVAAGGAGGEFADGDVPARGGLVETDHAMAAGDAAAGLGAEPAEEFARDLAEVDVGAGVHARGGDGHVGPAGGEERRPAADGGARGGENHLAEKMVGGHAGVAGAEVIDPLGAVHEAQVLDGVDELLGIGDHALGDGVGPELAGFFELLEDLDGIADIDRAVGRLRGRVAQLADAGVTGAGVVPAVGTFLGELVGDLVNLDAQAGLQPLEHRPDKVEPFIPSETVMREFTARAVITGAVLGMIFGASSLYLVLKVGLTVSASIPVAVISLAMFRGLSKVGLRDATILENNITQTAGSAGESIAFGVGVTMPAILILGFDLELSRVLLVALMGGLLGILMMIPLRRALIVKEHGVLKYPEGTACAAVLKAGASPECRAAASPKAQAEMRAAEAAGLGASPGAKVIFTGFGIGLLYKTLNIAFKGWKDVPEKVFGAPLKGGSVGAEISPELVGVGYIIGPRIASIMCAGGVLSYLLLIPLIKFFGDHIPGPLAPGTMPISEMGPNQIRGAYILYIGAGRSRRAG
jgi:hypothetical protein